MLFQLDLEEDVEKEGQASPTPPTITSNNNSLSQESSGKVSAPASAPPGTRETIHRHDYAHVPATNVQFFIHFTKWETNIPSITQSGLKRNIYHGQGEGSPPDAKGYTHNRVFAVDMHPPNTNTKSAAFFVGGEPVVIVSTYAGHYDNNYPGGDATYFERDIPPMTHFMREHGKIYSLSLPFKEHDLIALGLFLSYHCGRPFMPDEAKVIALRRLWPKFSLHLSKWYDLR